MKPEGSTRCHQTLSSWVGSASIFVPHPLGTCEHYRRCDNKTSDAPPPPKLLNRQLLPPLDNFYKRTLEVAMLLLCVLDSQLKLNQPML